VKKSKKMAQKPKISENSAFLKVSDFGTGFRTLGLDFGLWFRTFVQESSFFVTFWSRFCHVPKIPA